MRGLRTRGPGGYQAPWIETDVREEVWRVVIAWALVRSFVVVGLVEVEEIMNDKLLYRIPEVAEHLSISRSKVYELLKSGELRSVHIDRTRLVRALDLQAYVDSLAAA